MDDATVLAVSSSSEHDFSKDRAAEIVLIAGIGVEGDAHAGVTVQHLSRKSRHPDEPNLRQVHLIHFELHRELREHGYEVEPGALGENVTTTGIDLLALPRSAVLHLGEEALVEITGLRNPCLQIDRFQHGLLGEVVGRDESGEIVRKAGVMGIVLHGGTVRPGDGIRVELPATPHSPLAPV